MKMGDQMNKLVSLFKRAPKRTSAVVAMIAAAVIVPAALLAWGPSRQTYTTAVPADHVVFNSIIDNPVQGDERNFVQVREINASNATYSDSISLTAGHDYVVYVYYHNNAASNLNASGTGIATGAYVRAAIPAVVPNGSNDTLATGYVGSSNANPAQVWDNISFSNTTGGDIVLRYIPGSATIHNLGAINGQAMSDNIVTTGTALGYNSFDGIVPGCNQYAGYVTFQIRADQPNFTINKEVRIAGSTTWSKNITANAGDTVEYRIQYINTGSTTQNDVVIRDVLPANVNYIAGSTTLKNANNPTGKSVSDNVITGLGLNISNYNAGSNAYVKFSAKVSAESALSCGANTMTNTAFAQTNNGAKQDTAVVTVNKQCTTPVVPTTPTALPVTGPSENILTLLGLGALVTSAGYYITSRRALSIK